MASLAILLLPFLPVRPRQQNTDWMPQLVQVEGDVVQRLVNLLPEEQGAVEGGKRGKVWYPGQGGESLEATAEEWSAGLAVAPGLPRRERSNRADGIRLS